MELTFIDAPGFVREWNRLRLIDSDLEALEVTIGSGPASWPVLRGTSGLRKMRFAPPSMHKGKRGGMRVGYAHLQAKSAIVVVAIFAKTEVANFTAAERAEIAVWLGLFERSYR